MELILVGDITPVTRIEAKKRTIYTISDNVLKIIKNADISIGNAETTLTNSSDYDKSTIVVYKTPVDRAEAENIINVFTYLNLATNHILDYGYPGMRDTIKYLDE